MSGDVNVARACGCQGSGDGNSWCFVVNPSTCVEAEQVRSTWVAPCATPPQATAPKRTALAGTAPIHLVLLLRRQALRLLRHATAPAPDPTTAPCHAPATTRTPASTATAVCAANATVNPAAAVAYPRRPHPPAAPTGPTVGTFGARPAARRSAAPDARHGVLAHADWHCPSRGTESRLLHGGAPACPNAALAVPALGSCASSARLRQAWAAQHFHRE